MPILGKVGNFVYVYVVASRNTSYYSGNPKFCSILFESMPFSVLEYPVVEHEGMLLITWLVIWVATN